MVATGIAVMSMGSLGFAQESATAKLQDFHSGLLDRYPEVSHISADTLRGIPRKDVILFDVRKTSEYDVSRIEGAIRISPSMSAAEFLRDHGAHIKDKQVVFYCSVGERSSRLAERVMARAGDARPAAIHNLEGGIFNWHNEYRNVVGSDGPTSAIHPFNRKWGRLLERQDTIRMRPDAL